jgi:hypothetical protein
MTHRQFTLVLVLISCLLAGCQTTSDVVKEQQELSEQNQNYLEAQTALDDLTERFERAKTEDLDYYAAAVMKEAQRKLKTANEKFLTMRFDSSRATRRLVEKIQSSIDDANQLLDTASRLKAAAEATLGESFAQINRLKELDTPKLFPSDYRDVKRVLDGLVKNIADGRMSKAQDRQADLLQRLNALEIATIKQVTLTNANAEIDALKDLRADRYVPLSFQKAVAAKNAAEAIIASSPRDKSAIEAALSSVNYEISHTENLILEVKNLLAVERSDMEFYLLTIEAQLSQVAKILGTERISDRSISSQIQWIKNTSYGVLTENSKLRDMTVELEAELTKTAVANQDNLRKNDSVTSSLSDLLNEREILIKGLEQSLAQIEITNIRETDLIKDKLDKSVALNNELNREIKALRLNNETDKLTGQLALQELELTHQKEILTLQEQLKRSRND